MFYILVNRVPVEEPDLLKYAQWFAVMANRRVAHTERDGLAISTVFLGVDHGLTPSGPLLFETMVLGGDHDGYQTRAGTWEESEIQHELALRMLGWTTELIAFQVRRAALQALRLANEALGIVGGLIEGGLEDVEDPEPAEFEARSKWINRDDL